MFRGGGRPAPLKRIQVDDQFSHGCPPESRFTANVELTVQVPELRFRCPEAPSGEKDNARQSKRKNAEMSQSEQAPRPAAVAGSKQARCVVGRGDWNRPTNIPPSNPDSEWTPDRVEILGIQTFVQRLRAGDAA